MDEMKRSRLSPTQKPDIWRRWKAGQSLHEIGRAYGKPHPSIRCVLLPRGGIPPAARRRSRRVLTLAEREDISRSEEHTSELQSHLNLVCRLLLEKKKKISHATHTTKPHHILPPQS